MQQREANTIEGCPKLQLPHLRRALDAHSSKTFGAVARYEMDAIPYRICSLRAGNLGTRLTLPSAAEERSQGINGDSSQRFDAGSG